MITSLLRAPEKVSYEIGLFLTELLVCAGVLLLAWMLCTMFAQHRRMTALLWAAWVLGGIAFVLNADIIQVVDFGQVCDAAQRFACGDYGLMHGDYFHAYSYQLGVCLLLEGIVRLLPGADLNLLMQAANVVLSAGTVALLARIAEQMGSRKAAHALYALSLLCLPLVLYCIHVYGTLPMLCLCAGGILCFVRYIKERKAHYGWGFAVLTALAYVTKPNAAVVLIALLICAVLDLMESGDWKSVLFALLGIALAAGLSKLVLLQYELRSGVTLRDDVSMLARLVMGLEDGKRGAGWYTGYTEQFFPASVTAQQEKAIASADLAARLEQMAAQPLRTVIFFVQKTVSQWLEPTYGTLLYGNASYLMTGHEGGIARAVFEEGSTLRLLAEGYMKGWQMALHLLAAIGLLGGTYKRAGAAALVLPVSIFGGFLYHTIFEAKSQYIYVYMILMLPLAAQGLCTAADGLKRRSRKKR